MTITLADIATLLAALVTFLLLFHAACGLCRWADDRDDQAELERASRRIR
jgi:hypothetical protein